jgi:hypothetical protein
MKSRLLPVLGMLLLSSPIFAAGVDINVNSEAFRLTVEYPLPNRNVLIDGSWLHRGKADALSVGGYLTGKAAGGNLPLTAGLGTRFYYVNYDGGSSSQDGSNLALGGFVQYQFPQLDRLTVGGNLFYAPGVLSFGDSNDFYEIGTWVGYSVIRDAEVYLGWRRLKSDFDDGGETMIDTGVHIGLRARF